MRDAFGLEQPPDLDRARRREAAVRIDQLCDAIAQRARHGGHDRLGAARPFIDITAALGADAPLEGIESLLIAQPHEARGLGLRRDVALHG